MPWKIWFESFHNNEKVGSGVWIKSYEHKSSAVRKAKQMFGEDFIGRDGRIIHRKWIVSQTNPYVTR